MKTTETAMPNTSSTWRLMRLSGLSHGTKSEYCSTTHPSGTVKESLALKDELNGSSLCSRTLKDELNGTSVCSLMMTDEPDEDTLCSLLLKDELNGTSVCSLMMTDEPDENTLCSLLLKDELSKISLGSRIPWDELNGTSWYSLRLVDEFAGPRYWHRLLCMKLRLKIQCRLFIFLSFIPRKTVQIVFSNSEIKSGMCSFYRFLAFSILDLRKSISYERSKSSLQLLRRWTDNDFLSYTTNEIDKMFCIIMCTWLFSTLRCMNIYLRNCCLWAHREQS